jgi:hypothetical protein
LTIASDDKGAYGWKIVTNKDEVLFSGAGLVDGDYKAPAQPAASYTAWQHRY